MPPVTNAVLAAALLATVIHVPATQPVAVQRARQLFDLLPAGRYDAFVSAGTAQVREGLSAAQTEQLWKMLEFQHGPFKQRESASAESRGAFTVVKVAARFERARQHFRIVLDADQRLAGFWLDRAEPLTAYDPPEYVDPDRFTELELTVPGPCPLPATLTVPKRNGPHPATLLVHGSGPHDRDETVGANKPFRDLAWGLASQGIAVLRYEKRTKTCPQALPADKWTLADTTIDDAVAAVRLLHARTDIHRDAIFVVGHSLGGVAAPYIARKSDHVAGLVILAGSARSILDLILEQSRYIAEVDGELSAEESEHLEALRDALNAIRAGRFEQVPAELNMPPTFLRELHELNPPQAAASLDIPLLILQGGRDYQVTAADFALWQKHLGGQPNATLRMFDDLNHLFITGTGKSTPQEYQQAGHVAAPVVELIANWISERAKGD